MFPPLGTNEFRSYFFRRQLLCEFFGTFFLMLVRKTVSIVEASRWAVTKAAFAQGLTLAALTKLFSRISGAHISPAVSLSFFVVGEMGPLRFIFYIMMQFLGAIFAVIAYRSYAFANANADAELKSLETWQKILLEMILTILFIMLFRAIADNRHRTQRSSVSMAIGLAYTACLLSGSGISEVALNAFLHFSSDGNIFNADWMPAIGSTLGGVLGAWIYELLYLPHKSDTYRSSSVFDWLRKQPFM